MPMIPGMMTCREVESFLDDYLEGTLPALVKVRFEFHLLVCKDCRRYIARYRTAIGLGAKLLEGVDGNAEDAGVPEDLTEVIIDSLRAGK